MKISECKVGLIVVRHEKFNVTFARVLAVNKSSVKLAGIKAKDVITGRPYPYVTSCKAVCTHEFSGEIFTTRSVGKFEIYNPEKTYDFIVI